MRYISTSRFRYYNICSKMPSFQSEAKNMSVEVPSFNIRMIDSINFPPVALSELLIMFGLNELTKGYFQHLYNRTANQGIVMSHLPEILYYNPDSMSADPSKASNRKLFLEWYDTHLNDTFAFNAELLKYCRSDVLSTVFLSNSENFSRKLRLMDVTMACNLEFRNKILQPVTIGIIPAHGYRQEEKHFHKGAKRDPVYGGYLRYTYPACSQWRRKECQRVLCRRLSRKRKWRMNGVSLDKQSIR